MIGSSRWEVLLNVSVGYVYNRLFNYCEYSVSIHTGPGFIHITDDNGRVFVYEAFDRESSSVGFMFSTGIRYRIIPAIGVGIYTNGMFSSTKEQKARDIIIDNPRKMNRIGISAGLDFSF